MADIEIKTKIHEAFARLEHQREQIVALYSRAYEVIALQGKKSNLNPDDKRTGQIRSVARREDDLVFRIHIGTGRDGELPSKYGSGSDESPVREIVMEVGQAYNPFWSANELARLRLLNRTGTPKECASRILGREVTEKDILTDHSEGLALVDQVLTQVFQI